jgi:hypothetical protein
MPKSALQTESALIRALEEESETLLNTTDQFAPLISNFRIFFFWEQERMNLKYTREYIVDEMSAAPILDNTERCGIPADHNGICKFDKISSQAFRTVISALRRYSQEAPHVIKGRLSTTTVMLNERRRNEAMEMLGGSQRPSGQLSATEPLRLAKASSSRVMSWLASTAASADMATPSHSWVSDGTLELEYGPVPSVKVPT